MKYKIILEAFEGPMDLLMHLIDKSEIDIYDININEVTEQYIEYIMRMDELDLEITSEFLIMAATLLEIKSKMLLPQEKLEDTKGQSEAGDTDPRLELVEKLIEYKKYKYVSGRLKRFEKIQKKVYSKPQEDLSYYLEEDEFLEEMDLSMLVNALNDLILKEKKSETFTYIKEIQKEEYTLEEYMEKIEGVLRKKHTVKFSNLFKKGSNRIEIIIIFLSLLELIKSKSVAVKQKHNFSDILIIRQTRKGD